MPKSASKYYWLCQVGGWGTFALRLVLSAPMVDQRITYKLVGLGVVAALAGIFVTHIFREVIRRAGWLRLTVEKALPKFLVGVLLTCLAGALIRILMVDFLDFLSLA